MFYDRLLNLKSLKTRLLSSSSFAQLYSSDGKLPLAKFRREGISLTPLIAGLLAACGGSTKYVPVGDVIIPGDGSGGDGSGPGTPFGARDFTVTVADGAIEGALVYIDANNNGTFDAGDIELGRTDANGAVAVDAQYAGREITVDLAGAIDLFTATEFSSGVYKTTSDPRGADLVVSPLTYIVEELIAADPTLDREAALEILFGADSGVEYADIINPDNYMPASAPNTSHGAGHPISTLEVVSRTSINLQVLMEQHDFTMADIIAALRDADGFNPATDLTPESLSQAAARLAEARQRSAGEPLAVPQEGLSTNEDTDLAMPASVWGFRDPVGNTTDADSELVEVRIVSITNGQLVVIGSDGTETVKAAGETISGDELNNLVLRPNENYFGEVTLTYRVFDGEAASDIATLSVNIVSVNDLPSDIELTGDRDDQPGKANEQYVLFDGNIILADGTEAGQLTAADVETNNNDATGSQAGLTYALSGDHGELFEVVGGKLQLRADATPLSAGQTYNVVITVTDSDGGSYSETFNIVQGGLYVGTAGGARTYSNGDGLIAEEADGSGTAIRLGVFGLEGLPAGAQNLTFTLVGDGRDNGEFGIAADGTVYYTGGDRCRQRHAELERQDAGRPWYADLHQWQHMGICARQ